jgi:hypothetical protein
VYECRRRRKKRRKMPKKEEGYYERRRRGALEKMTMREQLEGRGGGGDTR